MALGEGKRRRAWQNMVNYARYHRLKVHPPWLKYAGFAADIGLPPAAGVALRRRDPRAGFIPGNVAWSPRPINRSEDSL